MTQKRKIGNVIASILKYAVLIFGAIFTILPFVWMISSSLKTPTELVQIPPSLFPATPQWSNYQ